MAEHFPERVARRQLCGEAGDGLPAVSAVLRHAKAPCAPPTAHRSSGAEPQMPNTVPVPGVCMRVKAPSW